MKFDIEDLIKYRIQKSHETTEDARIALENNRLRNALNRVYYSNFYIVSALALKENFSTSKHAQLLGWFNKNYIKTKIISPDLGKIYRESFDNRQESDYEDFVEYDKTDIEQKYYDMLRFVEEIEKLINTD
jgi:uncharacterized protein (UPF0332 family)